MRGGRVGRDREASVRAERARLLRGCGRNILGLALAVALLVGVSFVLTPISQLLFAPWSMGLGGAPTLTGTWTGPLRSKWGSEYYLHLDLAWDPPRLNTSRSRGRSSSRADLVGTARICNRAGKEFRLEVSGDADRSASEVRIDAEARDSRYRESLPLRGAWHGDTLDLSAFTSPFGPEGELRGARSTVTSTTTDQAGRLVELYPTGLTPDQVPGDSFPQVTLRKGGEAEFRAGCQSVRA
jgi:hypothetical protein